MRSAVGSSLIFDIDDSEPDLVRQIVDRRQKDFLYLCSNILIEVQR